MGSVVIDIIEATQAASADRAALNRLWEEMAEVLAPERRGFIGALKSGIRTEKIFDTTPLIAKRGLVNALGSMIRPKTTAPGKWYDIVTEDDALMENSAVKDWVSHAEERMWTAIYNPKAHFIQATGEVDDDIVTFGTGTIFTGQRRDRRGLLFRSFHMKNVFIQLNSDGEVDTIYIIENMTARQAAQRWKEPNLGKKTRDALQSKDGAKPTDKFDFIWCVKPRHDRDIRRGGNMNMPFASIVIDVASEHKVVEEGFEEFPFSVPRWDTRSGDLYGRGPGVMALPDVLTLNQMGKTLLRGLHRAVDPPWLMPSDSMARAPRMVPGKVSYYSAKVVKTLGLREPFIQMESRGRLDWGLNAQTAYRELVHTLFYRNVLNLPVDGPDMTATEVIERREEFVREIGAVFGRLEGDYSGPIVERVFNTMMREGGFYEPPEELRGQKVLFRFASPVEKAKRQIESASIDQGIMKILEISKVRPEVLDNIDWDEWTTLTGEASNFPSKLFLDDEKVKQLRELKQQQAKAEQEMQTAERVAGAAAKIPDSMMSQAA